MLARLRSIFVIPDLRNKVLFTLAMLAIFRVVAYVPVPGIDPAGVSSAIHNQGGLGQLFGLLDVFTGGSLQNFSIAAMGVYPYITASIVVQLLQGIIPRMGALAREGESGRNQLSAITRYITVPLAILQAFGQMSLLVNIGAIPASQFNLFDKTAFVPTVSTLLSLTAGTLFLVWLGELITEKGIGNGISLIIFANIMVKLPQTIGSALVSGSASGTGINNGSLIFVGVIVILALVMTFSMVYIQLAQRRVPVEYPTKRRLGMGGVRGGNTTTYIPLQLNQSGMIPIIFANSILLLPVIVSRFLTYSQNKPVQDFFQKISGWLDVTKWYYWAIFGLFVFAFTFFYATVLWEQQELANNLQKQGAFVPGVRPGPRTDKYLSDILYRITFGGALFLAIVAVAPGLVARSGTTQLLQASSLLIVVGVVLDTVKQLQAQMVMRNYSGFLS